MSSCPTSPKIPERERICGEGPNPKANQKLKVYLTAIDDYVHHTSSQFSFLQTDPSIHLHSAAVVNNLPSNCNYNIMSEAPVSLFVPSKLTSEVFTEENPPTDWADAGLLIPHEAIRRQMTMMVQSVNAMPDSPDDKESWKLIMFSKWYVDYFYESVHEHHDAEEKIYFPWMMTKATIPDKEFGKSHEDLMNDMAEIKSCCAEIIKKKGKGCDANVATLKEKVPKFEVDMKAHLKEEEEIVPAFLRDNFTQEEEKVIVDQIIQAGGLTMAKKFMPAVLLAGQEWMSDEFYTGFVGSVPPPIKHLLDKYFMPDFENVAMTMRDAPTLGTKPKLKRVPCCGIAFCFPCVI